jgi:hypothetical protein
MHKENLGWIGSVGRVSLPSDLVDVAEQVSNVLDIVVGSHQVGPQQIRGRKYSLRMRQKARKIFPLLFPSGDGLKMQRADIAVLF